MIGELQIKFVFRPYGILWYKFLSYIEVLCVLSEFSKLLELSELIELPEVFSSMKKCLFHGALRLGDPLIKLLELRFVSSSSETSRSSGTIQTSQSSISSHPVFPDEGMVDIHSSCAPETKKGLCTAEIIQTYPALGSTWKSLRMGPSLQTLIHRSETQHLPL